MNPELVERADGDLVEDWDGLLQRPWPDGPGPAGIVRYTDRDGRDRIETFEGYVARVVRHELDHLEGKVFLDRMISMASLSTIANRQRFGRDHS